ncbi:MAG: TRAP-type C4-dicarboxylate transport system substrate-binding protein [Glaciecola sp.]|jgi:TRAP-type C4-dicarboxylate transport system substrate-binding protein|uniref:TRAP transporter substrate-binding protein n=1 Tax=Sulfitobacter sp. TaxID=1903071 RepID=UPI0039E6CEEF
MTYSMTRKTFLTGLALAAGLMGSTAAYAEAEYTFRVSNVLSEQDVTAFGLNKFAELVSEASDGRIEIEVFHGGQLGSGVETFEAVKNGYLDFAGDSFANLATITPAFEIFHFPFLFESRAQMLNALGSDAVQTQVNSELADVGLVWFSTYEIGGPRNVGTSNVRIETAEDLASLKFRASRSPLEIGSHEAWGAAGVTVDWPGTPEAVRLGMVDGLTVPYASFYSAKFHEGGLINYILDLNFQNYALVIAANADKMAALPDDVRTILEDSAAEAQAWHVEFVSGYITENIQAMRDAGVEIYSLPDAEYQKVRDMTVDSVWPRFVGNEGMSQEKLDLIRTESGEIGTDGWGYSLGN